MRTRCTWRLAAIAVVALMAGCGQQYYIPPLENLSGELTVSAYTRDGCLEALQAEARARGVELRETRVYDAGNAGIIFWPLVKKSSCAGPVVRARKSAP